MRSMAIAPLLVTTLVVTIATTIIQHAGWCQALICHVYGTKAGSGGTLLTCIYAMIHLGQSVGRPNDLLAAEAVVEETSLTSGEMMHGRWALCVRPRCGACVKVRDMEEGRCQRFGECLRGDKAAAEEVQRPCLGHTGFLGRGFQAAAHVDSYVQDEFADGKMGLRSS